MWTASNEGVPAVFPGSPIRGFSWGSCFYVVAKCKGRWLLDKSSLLARRWVSFRYFHSDQPSSPCPQQLVRVAWKVGLVDGDVFCRVRDSMGSIYTGTFTVGGASSLPCRPPLPRVNPRIPKLTFCPAGLQSVIPSGFLSLGSSFFLC